SDNMVRQENIETASTVTSIIPTSTVNSDHNSTVIVTQNNQPEPISSALINLDIIDTLQKAKKSGASYNPSSSFQKGNTCDYGRSQPGTEGKGLADDFQTTEIGVPDPCRFVEKLNEFLPDCEEIPGPSQYLQIAQLMASIDGEEKHDAIDTRMQEKQPSTTQASAKNRPSGQQQLFQHEKAAKSSKQGQRKGTSHQTLQPGLQDSKNSTGYHGKCVSDGHNNDGI
ncbi:hypothetical protein O181_128023, partial [Austropuccinia psidii MF-1]|nr:hypothetical protein [Austropuccinia psidii MF-1]